MNKNNSNVKTGDMPTVNAKDIKAVTLSFEKFGFLRNVSAEEAGEFLQVILNYAMTGNMPEFKDKYQKMYYQGYLDVITEQMVAATKRADNLRKNAKERADAVKEAKKIIAKQGREAKGVIPSNFSVDEDSVTVPQTKSDNKRDVTSRSLFDDESGTDNADVKSPRDVDEGKDLTYAYLLSLGVKKDTGNFNGEETWNTMSDDAKLYMQEYARQHPEVQFVEAEDHSEEIEMFKQNDRQSRTSYDDRQEDGDTIHHHYQFGFYKCDFSLKRVIESLLDSEIKQAITEEKHDADDDYREVLNKNFDFDSTFKVAAMLFIGYVDAATSMSESIGGGGSSCTSGWGKKDDDEEEWARKCARQAVKMCKPQMLKQAATRPRGKGR